MADHNYKPVSKKGEMRCKIQITAECHLSTITNTCLIETIGQGNQDLSDWFNIFKNDEVSLNSMRATCFRSCWDSGNKRLERGETLEEKHLWKIIKKITFMIYLFNFILFVVLNYNIFEH